MENTATVTESQVDWLTVTHPQSDLGTVFNAWGRSILTREESGGNRRVPWKRLGYDGEHCGKASWGTSPQGAIIMLSGQAAADRLDTALDLAHNVSRLDIAVTVRFEPPQPDYEMAAYKEYSAWHVGRNSRMHGQLICGVDGGRTLYVGSRTSELFLRLYNKEVESRDPRTTEPDPRYVACHRWELEIKGNRPRKVAETISTSRDPTNYVRALIASYVQQHGMDDSPISGSAVKITPGFRRRSDADTKLEWLGSQVRGTVDWLRHYGHQAKVLHALGYDLAECTKLLQLEETKATGGTPQ